MHVRRFTLNVSWKIIVGLKGHKIIHLKRSNYITLKGRSGKDFYLLDMVFHNYSTVLRFSVSSSNEKKVQE